MMTTEMTNKELEAYLEDNRFESELDEFDLDDVNGGAWQGIPYYVCKWICEKLGHTWVG